MTEITEIVEMAEDSIIPGYTADELALPEDVALAGLATPAYLALSLLGLAIAATSMGTWVGVPRPGGANLDFGLTVAGLDAGGWGLAAIVAGASIFILGLIGYFVNPFSDPEALLIAAFSAAVIVGAGSKILDPASLVNGADEFPESAVAAGPVLWLMLAAAVAALAGAAAIVAGRARAHQQLIGD